MARSHKDKAKTVPYITPPALPAFLLPLAVCALLLSAATPGRAERADRDQPMHIEADALRYEERTQQSTFTGKVQVTKGSIVMRGEQLQVLQDNEGHQSGTMQGGPGQRAFFRQKREGLDEFIEGEGETIEYDGRKDTVRFVRRAELRRLAGAKLQDQIMGSVIVYNNVTEVYTVDGAPAAGGTPSAAPGGRVRAVLAPRNAPEGAGPSTPLPLQSAPQLSAPEAGSRP